MSMLGDEFDVPENLPYPSGAWDWFHELKTRKQKEQDTSSSSTSLPITADVKLRIAIVGAGLCGMTAAIPLAKAGHEVTVYEAASELGEVGAGIQVTPNATKYFWQWGVQDKIPADTQLRLDLFIRRWEDSSTLSYVSGENHVRDWGAPYMVIHRADLHRALHAVAVEAGARVRTGCRAVSYDFERPALTLASGEVVDEIDFIVASDGVKSEARRQLFGELKTAVPCGHTVYRTTIPFSELTREQAQLWGKSKCNIWVGPGAHLVTYPISAGQTLNLVLAFNDPTPPALDMHAAQQPDVWLDDLRARLRTWDPQLRQLLAHARHATRWPIAFGAPLAKWSSASGRCIILGDAAHAMAPYMAQGAAMAVEDAVALSQLLLRLRPRPRERDDDEHEKEKQKQLVLACRACERSRIPRVQSMQLASRLNGKLWHLPDGEVQRARDAAASPYQIRDAATQRWVFGFDAAADADRAWAQEVALAALF